MARTDQHLRPPRSPLAALRRKALLPALALCAPLGCADEKSEAPPAYETLPVIAGCQEQSYAACDPLEADCQARVFATVRCLRHMPDALLPPTRMISAAQQLAEFQASFAVQEPEQLAASQAEERALGLLGLVQAGELSSDSRAQVFVDTTSAYYTASTGQVTLIASDGEEPRDLAEDTLTLAHEFVHALQDQDVGLLNVHADTMSFDDYLARTCLIEGEATMIESFLSAALWGFGENPDFRGHFTSWVPDTEQKLDAQSPLLVAPRYVPYSYGARFVYDLYEQGGIEAVRERFRNPPHSVLGILHSVDQLEEPALESFAQLAAPGSLDGFQLLTGDSLGPWVFGKFLERLLPGPVPAGLVDAWRGDRLLVYAPSGSAQTLAALWTVRLADAETAGRLATLLQTGAQSFGLSAHAFYSRRERDVTIGVSENALDLPEWSASLELAEQTWGQAASAGAAPRLPRPGLSALLRRWLAR